MGCQQLSLVLLLGAATATGGIIGALTEAGVSEEDAHTYAEGVRRGGALVTARVPDTDRAKFDAMLDQSSVNIRDRRAMCQKSGWQRLDPQSKPYGPEEVRREFDGHQLDDPTAGSSHGLRKPPEHGSAA
jgi:hypothetical protein